MVICIIIVISIIITGITIIIISSSSSSSSSSTRIINDSKSGDRFLLNTVHSIIWINVAVLLLELLIFSNQACASYILRVAPSPGLGPLRPLSRWRQMHEWINLSLSLSLSIYIYIYIYIFMCIYIYIYLLLLLFSYERERESRQSRAEQSRAEGSGAEQSRAGQGRAGQSRAEQGRERDTCAVWFLILFTRRVLSSLPLEFDNYVCHRNMFCHLGTIKQNNRKCTTLVFPLVRASNVLGLLSIII